MTKNLWIATLVAAFTIAGAVMAVSAQRVLGGYQPVAKDNEDAVAAAEFAVKEQSQKQEMTYKLVSVEKAERQSAAGTNFRLCLKVGYHKQDDDVDATEFVRVVVFRSLQNQYSLTIWTEENCGEDSGTVTNPR